MRHDSVRRLLCIDIQDTTQIIDYTRPEMINMKHVLGLLETHRVPYGKAYYWVVLPNNPKVALGEIEWSIYIHDCLEPPKRG